MAAVKINRKRALRLILWTSVVALMVLVFVSLRPYGWGDASETYAEEINGEDPNNHSCVKLMKIFPLFKTSFDKWNKDAKNVAYTLAPSMTDVYSETDTQTMMKAGCIVPEASMQSFSLVNETRGDQKVCKGQSEDGKVSVVLPYVNDKVAGCEIAFNKYDAKGMEGILGNLSFLSNERISKMKEKAQGQVAPLKNTVNAYENMNNTLNVQTNRYNGLANSAATRLSETQSSLTAANATTSQLTTQNANLKAKFVSTW